MLLFLLNVFAISIPVALFEIWMEKDKGWGSGLPKDKWYGAIIGKENLFMRNLARIIGVPYFFGYAVFMYFLLIPVVLVLEYFFYIPQILFLFAVYIAILAVEDFSWFALNPYFPSLRELLKGPQGSIWWHKRWIRIAPLRYLPFSYFFSALCVSVLLFFLLLRNE